MPEDTAASAVVSQHGGDTSTRDISELTNDLTSTQAQQEGPSGNNGASGLPLPDPQELADLFILKDLDALIKMGGVDGILASLSSDRKNGPALAPSSPGTPALQGKPSISHEERQRVYGKNVIRPKKTKSFFGFLFGAVWDTVFRLTFTTAIVAFALGIVWDARTRYQALSCTSIGEFGCQNQRGAWVEGVAVVIAIWVIAVAGATSDKRKARRIRDVISKGDRAPSTKVVREGKECVIDTQDIVVGDIALLEIGDLVPCDGIYIEGHGVICNEIDANYNKFTYDESLEGKTQQLQTGGDKGDCFILSGSTVVDGVGRYVVVAVGPRSQDGLITAALGGDFEYSSNGYQLHHFVQKYALYGVAAFSFLLTALMIRFFVNLSKQPERPPLEKGIYFIDLFLLCLALLFVAVPEGLSALATLTISLVAERMLADGLLVRHVHSCETMASATVVCADKTGILTQNSMTVVAGSIGVHAKFGQVPEDHLDGANEKNDKSSESDNLSAQDFAIDTAALGDTLGLPLKTLFNEAICINSTALLDQDSTVEKQNSVGSATESALLRFVDGLGWEKYQCVRDSAQAVQVIPFSSDRKCMATVVKTSQGKFRLYLKGAPEILAINCSRYVTVHQNAAKANSLSTKQIDSNARSDIEQTITYYSKRGLHVIGVCYRDFPSWPPPKYVPKPGASGNNIPLTTLMEDLTLIAILALENPLHSDAREAVEKCRHAGITVKMCTGDHLLTARSIAARCGIYTPEGIIMEGPAFRALSEQQRLEVVPRLQVLARSSIEDKRVLVEVLKSLGNSVCVTGGSAGDEAVLKLADTGVSKGVSGGQAVRTASDLILMNDGFAAVPTAVMWGRVVNDTIRKVTQFQTSANITAVTSTCITAIASNRAKSAFSAVQLLWISFVIDGLASFVFTTSTPSTSALEQKPGQKSPPLFNTDTLKQIAFQSLYQIGVLLLFYFGGEKIFSFDSRDKSAAEITAWKTELATLVFNAFMFCQICNMLNCRRIDQGKNVFAGILRDWYFIGITSLVIVGQILIVFFGDTAFKVCRISGLYWGVSLAIGAFTLPLGFFVRLLPNPLFTKLFVKLRLLDKSDVLPVALP